ncbi:MAG TPA: hypothetical protein VFP71_02770 [Candidatus Angelobacter sp.]|nr:hypothetical protein [Candidatus Angelobacter sp.]
MPKKPTANDAQLIMELYKLRTEPVMRAARKFMVGDFWPKNHEEFMALMTAFGTEQNAWFRQALTYWNMAAAMVIQGAINEELFFATNGEPYFLWAKFGQFIPQARKEYIDAEFLLNLEKLASTPKAKARVKRLQERIAARAAAQAKAAQAAR